MRTIYDCDSVSLHVRVTNRAALTLYKDVLGYEIKMVDPGYYADKEDAYDMKLNLKKGQEESKAEEMPPESLTQDSDQYAETNPLAAKKGNEEEKVSKNKKKRDKAKAKKGQAATE